MSAAVVPGRPATAIEVAGLRKSFGPTVALDGVDLAVAEGTVFALLGPNGAGKTTAVHVMSTLLPPDAGTVRVGGHDVSRDPDRVRAVIGLTGQFSAFDGLLTGAENLRLVADLHHLDRTVARRRIDGLLERLDLVDAAGRPAASYSGGMQRRLDLALTLLGEPRVIFLDEPTAGLDPRSRRAIWEMVREQVGAGVTVFLTTQYLEEADRLANRIAVLDHGRVVAEGTPAELKRMVPGGHVRLEFADAVALERASAVLGGTPDAGALALTIPGDGGVGSLRALLELLDDSAIGVDTLSVGLPDLDDVFLHLTDHTAASEVPLR